MVVLLLVSVVLGLVLLLFSFIIVTLFLSFNSNKRGLSLTRVEKNFKVTDGKGVIGIKGIEVDLPHYDQFTLRCDQTVLGLPFTQRQIDARVGCGPISWGMLFNLYGKTNEIPKFKTMFPDDLNGAIPSIIELGNLMGTVNGGVKSPKYGVYPGFTWAHKMALAEPFLKNTGYKMKMYYTTFGLKAPLFHKLPENGEALWKTAVDQVKKGVPILVGYRCGGILHYAISHGHRINKNGEDELYINNGHNLIDFDNGWIRDPNILEEKKNAPFYLVAWIEKI